MQYLLLCWTVVAVCGQLEDASYWRRVANEDLRTFIEAERNLNPAKNVILFLGDGMGVSTVTASRILKGQKQNRTGEEEILSFEKFPAVGLAKTYSVDFQTTDSASSGTAILAGVKTNIRLLGLDSTVTAGTCSNRSLHPDAQLDNILHWTMEAGKSSGIVTTTRVTHATPAAAYARTPERNWEGDSRMSAEDKIRCTDIAHQLIMNNSNIQVILGGGRRHFLPFQNVSLDPVTGLPSLSLDRYTGLPSPELFTYGRRDGLDLINEWNLDKSSRDLAHEYVTNKQEFENVNTTNVDYLLGLFSYSDMDFEIERKNGPNGQPSLADMTKTSIEILQRNENGYFLYVEGGRIDHGHHINRALYALEETLAFEKAIEVAMSMTNQSDTLIVVTADHSHTMVISGYPKRGNPILGVMDTVKAAPTLDQLGFTTLLYANGPGYRYGSRRNLSEVDTSAPDYIQESAVPLAVETHSGEDVAVYASGPMSHLFTGVHELNYLAVAMAYAACVGADKTHCVSQSPPSTVPSLRENKTSVTQSGEGYRNLAPSQTTCAEVMLALVCIYLHNLYNMG